MIENIHVNIEVDPGAVVVLDNAREVVTYFIGKYYMVGHAPHHEVTFDFSRYDGSANVNLEVVIHAHFEVEKIVKGEIFEIVLEGFQFLCVDVGARMSFEAELFVLEPFRRNLFAGN